ncbi:hypothetical protein G4D71_09580 [Yersinia pestis]|nr:hypothetical protein F1598_12135 [Yersinia pestis]MBF2011541.1 hypothetical protein [Yersinia pestis]
MKRLLLSALLITPGTLLAADAQELPLLSGGDARPSRTPTSICSAFPETSAILYLSTMTGQ